VSTFDRTPGWKEKQNAIVFKISGSKNKTTFENARNGSELLGQEQTKFPRMHGAELTFSEIASAKDQFTVNFQGRKFRRKPLKGGGVITIRMSCSAGKVLGFSTTEHHLVTGNRVDNLH
jgi:hypothetical protein